MLHKRNGEKPINMVKTYPNAETLAFDDPNLASALFGPLDAHIQLIAHHSGASLSTRGTELTVSHPSEEKKQQILLLMAKCYILLQEGQALTGGDILQAYTMMNHNTDANLQDIFHKNTSITTPRKNIIARNASQRTYLNLIREKEMLFATGPAGTGKTYIAVAAAVSMLQSKRVKKIILTRPAVEAGEKLGFLPGDMEEKVNPYLRPLYDALSDMLGSAQLTAKQESGQIEVAPLAFMRGRTLSDAFIILDEAQNTTREQMKMFLTRMGHGSRAIITGDLTQIDLPAIHHSQLRKGESTGETRSGLIHAISTLKDVSDIGFLHFQKGDVVRHPLVGRIVDAYDAVENS